MTGSPQNPDALAVALADPSRRAILENLRFGPKSVTELVQATGLKQPNVSNHLARLRANKIVRSQRVGRHIHYAISLPLTDLMLRIHDLSRAALPGHDTLESRPVDTGGEIQPDVRLKIDAGRSINELREAFLNGVLSGSEDDVLSLVHEMLARRVDLAVIYSEVFHWAFDRIGEQVEDGQADVAHEHMASELTIRMMARVAQFYSPVVRSHRSAVLGCVAGNWHAVGLRMLSDALRIQGWRVLYLGANVPTDSFVEMANSVLPDLVIISCGMAEEAAELGRLVERLNASRRDIPGARYLIMIGGRYINADPAVAQRLSVDQSARNLAEFQQTVATVYGLNA